MQFGVHLPLIGFSDRPVTLDWLAAYTRTARESGFRYLAANDHLVFSRPWLDGPTALAAVLAESGDMTLATTVALPTVRGPVALAKMLGALDLLSGGRLIVGVGPGSSARDYAAAGLPFEERWQRLDEAVYALRALWGASEPYAGRFYQTAGMTLEPRPAQAGGPPLWVGSWGSAVGLRRVARLADGWLASAYNTTPALFEAAWGNLRGMLAAAGKDAQLFPNGLATMFMYITEDRREAERMLSEVVAPTVNRPTADLRERLLIGPAEACAAKLEAYQAAGVQRLLVWPVADEMEQLAQFQQRVAPLIAAA